jgi:glutamyl-tRNA reductase
MSTEIFVIGATHHRAPLAVREKLALTADGALALAKTFAQIEGLQEFAVLNTCNRIEFYGVTGQAGTPARIAAAFCAQQGFAPEEFANVQLSLQGCDAVHHLVAVSAGLDSQMLGETEIFGQVKGAYAAAQAAGFTGPVLNRLFQKSFQAAKHVRTTTAITTGQVSVANVAVDLALTIFGTLTNTRILLLGAGEVGEKTAKAFQSRGAAALTVASRRFERAMELATALDASAMPFTQREARLAEFDVVVCATSAPDLVISLATTRVAMARRPGRPLFFIDLALPRDIDPQVAEIDNVFVYNLDDLAKIAEQNRRARVAEMTKCLAIARTKAEIIWQQISAIIGSLPLKLTSRAEGLSPP